MRISSISNYQYRTTPRYQQHFGYQLNGGYGGQFEPNSSNSSGGGGGGAALMALIIAGLLVAVPVFSQIYPTDVDNTAKKPETSQTSETRQTSEKSQKELAKKYSGKVYQKEDGTLAFKRSRRPLSQKELREFHTYMRRIIGDSYNEEFPFG